MYSTEESQEIPLKISGEIMEGFFGWFWGFFVLFVCLLVLFWVLLFLLVLFWVCLFFWGGGGAH